MNKIEQRRLTIQAEIDGKKTQTERNRLGQFATPTALAQDILKYAATIFPAGKVHFLDPAIGTGSFYSALREVFPEDSIAQALGYEIDPCYGEPALKLWSSDGLSVKLADFTKATPSPHFNLIICNPPYVRHHHLDNETKQRLQIKTQQASGMKINGLAGLYCHFIGLSHAWMSDKGIAGWLIPSEFMDVNYGQAVKRYLLEKVTLLHIHRFDPNDVQFADALVSSAVVWFQKTPPPKDHTVTFSFGGTLLNPSLSRIVSLQVLEHEPKWSRFPIVDVRMKDSRPVLSDFFNIRRGIATGSNSYFVLEEKNIKTLGLPRDVFYPILPSPRYLLNDEVRADQNGFPEISRRLFLLNTRLSENEIRARYSALHAYLEKGIAQGIKERYLCRHRTPWYAQENRPPAPILCTYIGRSDAKNGRPFRFILNNSKATVANVYLAMYPTGRLEHAIKEDKTLLRRVWVALNALKPEELLSEGRVYGGGLHKLEPKELANVDATAISKLLPCANSLSRKQMDIFGNGTNLSPAFL